MSDPSLGSRYHLKSDVNRAESKLRSLRRTPTGANVLAEQNLGFWVGLFDPHHYRLLRGIPIQVFSNLPSGIGRKEVANALHAIRQFRNRVYHNEPICFDTGCYELAQAKDVHQQIIALSTWMDPAFGTWMGQISRVDRMIGKFEALA